MKVYIYESHLGDEDYVSTKPIPYEDRYCETCGDSDCLVDEGEPEYLLECERLEVRNAIAKYRRLQELLRPYMKGNEK